MDLDFIKGLSTSFQSTSSIPKVKVEPTFSTELKDTQPPICLEIFLQMERPRPMPF